VAGGTGFLFGFDMGTGQQVSSWKMTSFPALKHVWGGLQLDAGRHLLYAALGSVGCDATPYQGQLLAFNTSTGSHQTFTVMASAQNGGGIWGWGGASLDANGNPFVATGNGLPNGPGEANLYAERVIKLSAGNMSILGYNHPTNVSGGKDLDFGATPTIMDVPGCGIPRVAANNKNGHQYIWNRNNLNAGPIEDLTVAGTSGTQHLQGLPAYDPTTGQMFTTVPTSGPTYQHGIMSRKFASTSSGCRTQPAWAQTAGPTSSPVSSPTLANGVVYYADGQGKAVHAFNAGNGSPLWSSAAGDLGGSAFSAPTVFNGVLYVSSRDGTLHSYAINDFSISANPTSLSLAQGASGDSTISTIVVSGSPQAVNLSISGLPSGATASFDPTSVTAGSSSTLTVNAGTAAPGTYPLTVTGTGSSATHSTPISLTITGP
jgi:outer membrane protein assembly factor BamB